MYRFDLIGYAFGAGQALDITWCGYNYQQNGKAIQQVNTNRNTGQSLMKITQYYKGDSLTLKFGPINRYRNAFSLYYQAHYAYI